MDDFKKIIKMATGKVVNAMCSGGSMGKKKSYKTGGEVSHDDIVEDKKLIKKAFKMHDEQEHHGDKTDLSKLRKGGRAKKEAGTVRKYKTGGSVSNENKKPSGHADATNKVTPTGNKKADAPSKGSLRPNFRASDVELEKNKPAGSTKAQRYKTGGSVENAYGAKKTDKDIDDIANTKRQKPAKLCGGKSVKKMADGRSTGPVSDTAQKLIDMENLRQLSRIAQARKYLGPSQQAEAVKQGVFNTPSTAPAANIGAGNATPGAQDAAMQGGQKRGGKVRK